VRQYSLSRPMRSLRLVLNSRFCLACRPAAMARTTPATTNTHGQRLMTSASATRYRSRRISSRCDYFRFLFAFIGNGGAHEVFPQIPHRPRQLVTIAQDIVERVDEIRDVFIGDDESR